MTKKRDMAVRILVISLAVVAISRGGVGTAATLPVATVQSPIENGLRTPTRLAIGPSGSLYVADPANRGVLKYGADGKLLQKARISGVPLGVACTADGKVLVSQGSYVSIYGSDGSELGRLGSGSGQFKLAGGIGLDDAGNIYVTDRIANCVQVFSSSGKYQFRFGTPGTGAGQFNTPTAVAFEKVSRQLAVADTLNGRVQFFDLAGAPVRTIGSAGSGPLKFVQPEGVTFEYGASGAVRMYVADGSLGTIQAIEPVGKGTFLAYIGSGQFNSPSDVEFDQASSRLYVVDGDGEVAVFSIADGSEVTGGTLASGSSAVSIPSANPGPGAPTISTSTTAAPAQLALSTVADGSVVTQKVLDVTGVVAKASRVAVNDQVVPVVNGQFDAAVLLVPGSNSVTVEVQDQAGGTAVETRSITLDADAPVLSVSAPDVTATSSSQLTLKGTIDRSAYITVAGVPADTSNSSWSAKVTLAPGLNTIVVEATDLDGRVASLKNTVFYNASAPDLRITTPAVDIVTAPVTSYTVKGQVAVETGLTVTAAVNGKPVKAYVNNGQITLPLALSSEGSYTVSLAASDPSGNVSTVARTIVVAKQP